MTERAPLYFEARLGGLFPASAKAEEAMREVKGRVRVTMSGGVANQRRRGLYWSILALVTPLVNQRYNLTLDEDDLHEITRIKLKMYDEITLPSGEVHRKLWSTSNRDERGGQGGIYQQGAGPLVSMDRRGRFDAAR